MALSFFALLDDITSMMQDVATMTKVATSKTAGILGDDLAVNANQLQGISAKRELPVLWKIIQGSLINKAILVPLALLLSAVLPQSVTWLLLCGGLYLCYEGTEKLLEWLLPEHHVKPHDALKPALSGAALEKTKISSAIKTDFVLSTEIVVIALGILQTANKPFQDTVIALAVIAVVLTFAVYGIVAVIIKLDDVGLHWVENYQGVLRAAGRGLLWFAPRMLQGLTVVGTIAMFVVGGHIWVSHIAGIEHTLAKILSHFSERLHGALEYGLEITLGVALGWLCFIVVALLQKSIRCLNK